jgi:hypothetical protein
MDQVESGPKQLELEGLGDQVKQSLERACEHERDALGRSAGTCMRELYA